MYFYKIFVFSIAFFLKALCYDNAFLINSTKTFYAFPDETGSYSFTGWTKTATPTASTCNSIGIIGLSRYNNMQPNNYVERTYSGLGLDHYKIKVEAQLYMLDTWDWDPSNGYDKYEILMNGVSFTGNMTKTNRPFYACLTGGSAKQYGFSESIPHTTDAFTLKIINECSQGATDESFGFSHVRITVYYCHPRCVTCNGGGDISHCATCDTTKNFILDTDNYCKCPQAYYFYQADIMDIRGSCLLCPQKKWSLKGLNQCADCHITCQTCQGGSEADKCQTCPSTRTLNSNTECICKNYYMEQSPQVLECVKCHSSCFTCTERNRKDRCLTCAATDNRIIQQLNSYDRYCVCKDGYTESSNACVQCPILNCQSCTKLAYCTKCYSLYILNYEQNKCVLNCPLDNEKTYFDANKNKCLLCSEAIHHCLTCTSSTICLTCQDSYSLYTTNNNEILITTCKTCADIIPMCEVCDENLTSCLQYKKCPNNQYLSLDKTTCTNYCQELNLNSFGNENYQCESCYNSCPFCFGSTEADCINLELNITLRDIQNPSIFEIDIKFAGTSHSNNRRQLSSQSDVVLSEGEDILLQNFLKYFTFDFQISGIDNSNAKYNVINQGIPGKLLLQIDYFSNLTDQQDLTVTVKKNQNSVSSTSTNSELFAFMSPITINYDDSSISSESGINHQLIKAELCGGTNQCYNVFGKILYKFIFIKIKSVFPSKNKFFHPV